MNNGRRYHGQIEELLKEGLTYKQIINILGCSKSGISAAAGRIGIKLPTKKRVKRVLRNCLNCEKLIVETRKKNNIYCNRKCYSQHHFQEFTKKCLDGEIDGKNQKMIPFSIRRYLIEKYSNRCTSCGWNEINPYTGKVPLEVDHIDGNYFNNKEENLTLLCPNCHSLTKNFKALNKGRGRPNRRIKD